MASKVTWHPKLGKFQRAIRDRKKITNVFVTPSQQVEYINSGSTVLNLLIGGSRLKDGNFVCPGWPKGSIIEIFGREGSGKSTIAMTAMGQALLQDANACGLYVDLEHAVKAHYAMKLGCDFRPPELGGNGRAILASPHTFEETEALVMMAALQGIDIIVIDSVAGLVPRREAARDTADAKQVKGVAEVPRLMSDWMPKLQAIISKTKTCVIFLNQTRDKIGASPMARSEEAKKTTTGGNALKFWASIRLLLTPSLSAKAKVWNPLLKTNEDVQISTEIRVKMIKNKIDAKQGHTGLITIRYGIGIDELRTMLTVAEAYGIVSKSKGKNSQITFSFKMEKDGKSKVIKGVGIEKFRSNLVKEGGVQDMIQKCTDQIVSGFRMIDDERLAELAEDAITHDYGDGDEYLDDDVPTVVEEDGVKMTEDGEIIEEDDEAAEIPSITPEILD